MQVFLWFFKPYFYVWILDWGAGMQTNYARQFGLIEGCSSAPRFYLRDLGWKKKHFLWKVRTIIPFCDVVIDQLYRVWRLFRFPDQKSKRSKTVRMILLSNVNAYCTLYNSSMYELTITLHTLAIWFFRVSFSWVIQFLILFEVVHHHIIFLKPDFCLDFDRCSPDLWTHLPFLFGLNFFSTFLWSAQFSQCKWGGV